MLFAQIFLKLKIAGNMFERNTKKVLLSPCHLNRAVSTGIGAGNDVAAVY